jgi:23S rRNA (cytosine1962-C5)-methyltransferase
VPAAARVILREGRDGPVRGLNPWIFSRAIGRIEPAPPPPGSWVAVHDASGNRLGYGHFNPATTIAVRMLSWNDDLPPERIIGYRIRKAIEYRRHVVGSGNDCYRLVNGDGDGLSGLVADRYASVIVLQILSAGMEGLRDFINAALMKLAEPDAIVERSQGAVRRQEGLADRRGVLAGEPAGSILVRENEIRFEVDFERGQKTGAFLDQRDNRVRFGSLCKGARVLDLCCYTGGFSLAALAGGAQRVTAVDTSVPAIDMMRRNLSLNPYPDRTTIVRADTASFLRSTNEKFDCIVLDPPPLARSREHAARAGQLYVELNALAMRALAPGGHLMTFSCSAHFQGGDFLRAVRIAQQRSGACLRLIAKLGPGADHPVLLGHAEGEYLTGLLLADLG